MEVEDLGRPPRQIERGKHTGDFPDELQTMKEFYSTVPAREKIKSIRNEDLEILFDRYSKNLKENLYTVAEALNISTSTLHELLKRKDVKAMLAPYKERRQKLYSQTMMEAALGPYEKIKRGEDVFISEIKAADLAAKYCAFAAKSLDPDFGANTKDDGQIQVHVNTLVQVKDFTPQNLLEDKKVIDVEAQEVTEDGNEY